jgi:hypothetical protein
MGARVPTAPSIGAEALAHGPRGGPIRLEVLAHRITTSDLKPEPAPECCGVGHRDECEQAQTAFPSRALQTAEKRARRAAPSATRKQGHVVDEEAVGGIGQRAEQPVERGNIA